MSSKITLTNILENTCLRHSLLAQHGQSFHLDYFGNQYLFDVGEIYKGFYHNFTKMGFSLEQIKGIIISHRHLDHCGSLSEILPLLDQQKVYILEDLGKPENKEYSEKYRYFSSNESQTYNIALDEKVAKQVKEYENTQLVSNSIELEKGLFIIGPIGEKMQEQALAIKTDLGIVVIVGCSHPTLEKIVGKAQEITGQQKVYGIIGGFHFKDSSIEELSDDVAYLRSLNPAFVMPGHCTGAKAVQYLQEKLGEIIKVSGTNSFGTGNSVELWSEFKINFV